MLVVISKENERVAPTIECACKEGGEKLVYQLVRQG